jgi:pimeloyl-ACP methyl ester carboxylesterase
MRTKELEQVPVGGGELTVARWLGDGPRVLAVHGITASHMAWPAVVDQWPQDYNVIAPDLRGRGASKDLPAPFGITAHVADLLHVLDHYGWDSSVFVGHSLGAYIGVRFAVSARDRVRGLVLVDGGIASPLPEGRTPDEVIETTLGPAIERLGQTFDDREGYREFWRRHPALQDEDAWNSYTQAYVDYDLGGSAPNLRSRVNPDAVRADGRDPLAPEMVTLIDGVDGPILLLTAPRGLLNQPKPFLSASAVAAKNEQLANLSCVQIEDTNHYTIIMGSGRQRSAGHIERFIGSLETA